MLYYQVQRKKRKYVPTPKKIERSEFFCPWPVIHKYKAICASEGRVYSMTDYTDEELMSFVKNQDVSAFEELFRRYELRVFAFLCRLAWNAEEIRDSRT